jgi:hypothetical protein
MVERNLSWLAAQLSRAREIARNSRRFGIFGSSNSSTWLAGALMKDVAFFVDEDLSRVGRTHLERPIIHPTQVDERADVFVPLIPNVAKRVAKRYGSEYGRYHTPPDLDAST